MQIDWWTLGIQTINFLIVIWLLSRFLYQPVRRTIDEREAADRQLAEEAEAKAKAAEAARQEYERRTEELEGLQRDKETELHDKMEKERTARLQEAQQQAEALLNETRAKLDRERDDALKDLRREIVEMATDLARHALAQGTTPGEALQEARTTLASLEAGRLTEIEAEMATPIANLTVVTAKTLSDPERTAWRELMRARFGDGVAVSFSEDTEILGGVELHFPHAVLRMSVAKRLEDAAGLAEA